MTSKPRQKVTPLPFAYQLLAGTMAGFAEVVCMHPLDVVKTRLQLQTLRPLLPKPSTMVPYTSMIDCFAKTIQNEGASRLYRGVIPPLVAEAAKRAIKFGANEQWGFAVKKLFSIDNFSMAQAGFVGALAGATEAFWVTPFDLVKVRLQDRASLEQYRGTIDCVRKVLGQEGAMTFSHGLEATLWRHASFSGVYFMIIHGFRTAFPQRPGTTKNEAMLRNFIAGTMGGFLGTLVNTPFDVVKSRIQNQRKGTHTYGFTLPSVAKIYREEGFRALYKGLAPKTVRLGLGGGLMLVVFDSLSDLMRKRITQQPALEAA
ncbi:hypothetical protein BG006_000181 [Podila minutissima]|uniref:Mitochondrial 2-oxodicarboxylate carrier n=1 Tax=Podila minutissima TaxID=64525 RepID=A0A9P5SSB5_9FUNG|nr:hypothetical protein BG006_000181 [Podila minutissima]